MIDIVKTQMQKYKIIKVLGDGAFGTVFKAVNTKNSEVVAIKKMKQKYKNWQECLQLRQIKSLRKLTHPNIIKLKQVLLVSEELHLVFQYLSTNLYEEYSTRKKDGRQFSEKEIKNILFQIANSLAHLHKNGFFHRDLKPENLLISGDHVSLCDFGLAREIRSRPPFTDYVSTRWYRAPQLLLRSTNYNSPVDAFAFACIAIELYNLAPIFAGSSDTDQLNRIVKVLGLALGIQVGQICWYFFTDEGYYFPTEEGVDLAELVPRASPQAISLITKCMRYSSRHRLSMQEVLKHQYFQNQTFFVEEARDREIPFEQKQKGQLFDNLKPQKQLFEEFRMTKQQFRKTRKEQAFFSDPLRNLEKAKPKPKEQSQDLDQILKELQEKKKKKNQSCLEKPNALNFPMKITREKFYTQVDHSHEKEIKVKPKRQKTLADELLPQRYYKGSQQSPSSDEKGEKGLKNIFGFKFQPASLPYLAPVSFQKNNSPILQPRKKMAYFSINNSTKETGRSLRKAELSPLISPFHS